MASADQLRKIMPKLSAERATLFAPHLNAARERFAIDTLLREAAFLAQLAHESGEFRWMKEIWGPNKWQLRYEGAVASLGNTQPGDGKRFMGRGPIQITGRANYTACSKALGHGTRLLKEPELLEGPELGCLAAAWFWDRRKINVPADQQNFYRVTQLINGRAALGHAERVHYYQRALQVLGVAYVPIDEPDDLLSCTVIVDDEDMTKVLDPFLQNGRVKVRVRPYTDRIGWKISAIKAGTVSLLSPAGKVVSAPFENIDGSGYVFLRDLPSASLAWDAATRTARIDTEA